MSRASQERRAAQTASCVGAALVATALLVGALFAADWALARWERDYVRHLPHPPRGTATHSAS